MDIFYELIYSKKTEFTNYTKIFKDEKKLYLFIEKNKDFKYIKKIKYYTIYEHTKNKPKIDEIKELDFNIKLGIYYEKYKLEKESLVKIKVKDYENNIQKGNNNYLIEYYTIDNHPYMNKYLIPVCENYISHDLKEIKKRLYALSKSVYFFNIKLYQFEEYLL